MSDSLSADLASLRIHREPEPRAPGRGKLVLAVMAAGVVAALVWFVAVPTARDKLTTRSVTLTEIALISPAQASTVLTVSGYVVPQVVSQVAAKVAGRVTAVPVSQGQRVSKGQALMVLDAVDIDAAIAVARSRTATERANATAAQANLAEVEQQFERERKSSESGISAVAVAEDLQKRVASLRAAALTADARVKSALAEARALQVSLDSYTVVAPIDGTVVSKPPQVGEMVGPTMGGVASQLGGIAVADFGSLAVEADVPEGRLSAVEANSPAEIILDAFPSKRFRGRVSSIVPQVDRAKATVLVKVAFVDKPENVLPEMSARVGFLSRPIEDSDTDEGPKVIVPSAAVTQRGDAKVVFVVQGQHVRMVPLELGEAMGDGFVVLSGPAPGTKVVRTPGADLADGDKIKEATND